MNRNGIPMLCTVAMQPIPLLKRIHLNLHHSDLNTPIRSEKTSNLAIDILIDTSFEDHFTQVIFLAEQIVVP